VKFALDQSAIVATTDVTGVITSVNDKFCEISQYSREELIGRDHRIINSGRHGKRFFRGLWTTIGKGRIWRGEICNRAKDGSLYWVDTTIVPFLDGRGKPYQYMAIRYDVTQRREVESRARQQEALARIGEMTAVVAHEVRNPLAGISGVLQVVGSRLPADSRDRAILGDVQDRIAALNRLLRNLLVFSRPRQPTRTLISVRAVVNEAVSDIRHDPALSSVTISVTGSDPSAALDREQMHIVFLDVLLNAADAMRRRGRIDVTISAAETQCQVAVADRGPGAPPDVFAKMFQPFFTTKRQGTGLGLPTARRIVAAHGGALDARPRDGGGLIMTVTLPMPEATD